jgi:5-formyltetrahydrofolate cyclo-ligase
MNERKRALRSEAIAARARLGHGERAAAALAFAARIDEVPGFRAARVLAVYAPLGTEADPTALALRAAARGATLLYPRVRRGDRRLAFAPGTPGALVVGPLGALEPPAGVAEAPLDAVDAVVVPCLACSPDGLRLGRGGGYYDATLPAMPRALRVGVAFEVQLVPALPGEPHDARLDALVTERRVLLFEREPRAPGARAT